MMWWFASSVQSVQHFGGATRLVPHNAFCSCLHALLASFTGHSKQAERSKLQGLGNLKSRPGVRQHEQTGCGPCAP